MSATGALSNFYGNFFRKSAQFAVSPYTNTFLSIASNKNDDFLSNAIGAYAVCTILTFVVPVLPALCSLTFSLASIAMLLSVASMFATYPIALGYDVIAGGGQRNDYAFTM